MVDTVISFTAFPPFVSKRTVYLFFSHFAYNVCAFVTSYGNVTLFVKELSVYQPTNVYPFLVVTGDLAMVDTVISLTAVPSFVSNCTVYFCGGSGSVASVFL